MTAISRGFWTTALALAAVSAAGPALAGSLGEGGFSRYVPAVIMPTLNETPFITTEVKPIYIYHKIPNGFLTEGGDVNVVALQARLAITDRLGFIATTDGYTWIDFDKGLENAKGWNDITAGLKYAVVSDPEGATIATIGARYTAPIDTLETGSIDLNGTGNGYLDVFASAAQVFDRTQIQGSIGGQFALSSDNWSYFHGHLRVDHEIFQGVYPLIEANLIAPFDGGNQLKGTNLTGAEIVDIGASDPESILTLAAGLRVRASDNIIFGAAFEKNVLSSDIKGGGGEATVWDWRITTDVTTHF